MLGFFMKTIYKQNSDKRPSTLSTDRERTKSGYIPIPITGIKIAIETNSSRGPESKTYEFGALNSLYPYNIWRNIDNEYIGVNIIPIAITKVIPSFDIKRYFWLVMIPKKTINSATKPLIPGNAREAIEKLLNIVNIFGIGIAIPPISSRYTRRILSELVPAKKKSAAPINPRETICKMAPLSPVSFIEPIPISIKPCIINLYSMWHFIYIFFNIIKFRYSKLKWKGYLDTRRIDKLSEKFYSTSAVADERGLKYFDFLCLCKHDYTSHSRTCLFEFFIFMNKNYEQNLCIYMINTYLFNKFDWLIRVDFLLRYIDETIASPIAASAAAIAITKIEKIDPFNSRLSKKSENVTKFILTAFK
uniref:NADH-plastoquinone oxidoreductase subunit 1 n=1 Tax=Torilis scabra TaxID=79188 RepID=A0A650DRC5_9APIA|nr:NADH-plastoquinone oxidoreductase subunit 1 [Torilis scabra]